MNKDDVFNYLCQYLSRFLYHPEFITELQSLISGKGFEARFFKLLVSRFTQLSALGQRAVCLEEFEQITEDLFSMHFSQKDFNIRFLYGFLPNNQPVLLLPFYERAGKRKTDYTSYIEPALSRFSEMKEEFYNE